MTTLVDGTIPVAADFNNNFTNLNSAIGASTAITSYTTGDTLYASGTNTLAKLVIAGNGQVLGATAGIPAWSGHLQSVFSRLVFTNATTLTLNVGVIPLKVGSNWLLRPITAALTIANTALVANTSYFVYVSDVAGTSTLALSTTTHATDTTFGVETKSGDALSTLVGMIRTGAGTPGVFADSNTQRFTISYFSRRAIGGVNRFTANRTTTSASLVEVNTEIRVEFVTWPDEAVYVGISGGGAMNIATATRINPSIDGGTTLDANARADGTLTQAIGAGAFQAGVAEGYHYATLLAAVSGGVNTLTFSGGAVGDSTAVIVGIRG